MDPGAAQLRRERDRSRSAGNQRHRRRESGPKRPQFPQDVITIARIHDAHADDPSLYRDESETARWLPYEPVGRMGAFLRRLRVLDDDTEEELRSEAKEHISAAVRDMEAIQQPDQNILFDGIYASGRPWTFGEALQELTTVERRPEVRPLGVAPSSGAGAEGKTQ